MALTLGAHHGRYDIVAQIGEGGMGQVSRARDIPLNRDVALSVLPDAFTDDADRLARFTVPVISAIVSGAIVGGVSPKTAGDVMLVELDGAHRVTRLVQSLFAERKGSFRRTGAGSRMRPTTLAGSRSSSCSTSTRN